MLKKLFSTTLMLGLLGATPAMMTAAQDRDHDRDRGRCPNIHKAVAALEAAKHDLETAQHKFCGHRDEAIEATNRALEQLRKAERCDKCGGEEHEH